MVRKRPVGVVFSAEWLTLREPADSAARDSTLLRQAVQVAGEHPVVLDLGCGTGATVRTLSPYLPESTVWKLVDNNADLLGHARRSAPTGSSTHLLDIDQLESLPLQGVTLMTASALFDLVSESWVERLAQMFRVPMYVALSYNGHMSWSPSHPHDTAITEAFNRHQRLDKGLGPAVGPDSVATTTRIFTGSGFSVVSAPSLWRLGPESTRLQRELIHGIAHAASEMGESSATEWASARLAAVDTSHSVIGHEDLLIIPFREPGASW